MQFVKGARWPTHVVCPLFRNHSKMFTARRLFSVLAILVAMRALPPTPQSFVAPRQVKIADLLWVPSMKRPLSAMIFLVSSSSSASSMLSPRTWSSAAFLSGGSLTHEPKECSFNVFTFCSYLWSSLVVLLVIYFSCSTCSDVSIILKWC